MFSHAHPCRSRWWTLAFYAPTAWLRLSSPAPAAGNFTWEGRDSLTSANLAGVSYQFAVNGDQRRISKTVGGTVTRFVLDQSGPLEHVLVENDGSNAPRRYYIHGLGLLGSIDASTNDVFTYHFNHRGDTLALTNPSQNVTDRYAYSAFGAQATTGSTPNPFRFAGQVGIQTDSPDLLFMRARYYQPALGRFISQDPSGFSDGMNVFAYVGGGISNALDPSGSKGIEAAKIMRQCGADGSLVEFDITGEL